jgi:hypothetical protein
MDAFYTSFFALVYNIDYYTYDITVFFVFYFKEWIVVFGSQWNIILTRKTEEACF